MIPTMVYDEEKYIKTFAKIKEYIACIKIKEKKYEFSLVETDKGKAIEIDDENPEKAVEQLLTHQIKPDAVYWDLNILIESINITIDFLVSSYSLLKMEYEAIKNSTEDNPTMYWFIYHYENTVSRISTLNDLLFNLTNSALDMGYKEDFNLRKQVLSSLKKENQTLKKILERKDFKTKVIRDNSTHNTKPFYYKNGLVLEDGVIVVREGARNFNLIDDYPKIDEDIHYLKQKYLDTVPQLALTFHDN